VAIGQKQTTRNLLRVSTSEIITTHYMYVKSHLGEAVVDVLQIARVALEREVEQGLVKAQHLGMTKKVERMARKG